MFSFRGNGPKPTSDIRNIVKDTIRELLSDEEFINRISNRINDKLIGLETAVNRNMDLTKKLEGQIEILQKNEKMNNICVYNFPEEVNQNISRSFSFCKDKMNTQIKNEKIVKCCRTGSDNHRPRPIKSYNFKENILKNDGKLSGTGIGIMEDLVKNQLSLYEKAPEKLNRKNVFTIYGNVIRKKDGKIQRIIDHGDLNIIQEK